MNPLDCEVKITSPHTVICDHSVCGCQKTCPKRRENQDRVETIRQMAADVRSRRR